MLWYWELIMTPETRNHGDVASARGVISSIIQITLQTCHAKPKTQIKKAGRRQLLPVQGCLHQAALGLKDFSPKVRTLWHCSRLRSVALTYDWSWWYPSGNRPLQQYLGFTAGRWLWQFEYKAEQPDCKIQRSGERSERLMYEQSHRDYLRSVICIIVCLSWAVNHYRDNAITYKAQRDKNARELKLANAAITDMQMRQRDVAALDANTRRS